MTTDGICGYDLTDGRGGIKGGLVLCRSHTERPIMCDGCGGLLPRGLGVGRFSDKGRWCSDHCQLAVKYVHLIENSTEVPSPFGFEKPCRVYHYLNDSGYPRLFARFGGKSVWLGHRLAWFHENGITDISPFANRQMDHMCQNKGCFEPSHMQWLDSNGEHALITWDRHDEFERGRRLVRMMAGGCRPGFSIDTIWNGFRVIVTPIN